MRKGVGRGGGRQAEGIVGAVLDRESGIGGSIHGNNGVSASSNRIGDRDLLLIRVIGNDGIGVRLPSDIRGMKQLRRTGATGSESGAGRVEKDGSNGLIELIQDVDLRTV